MITIPPVPKEGIEDPNDLCNGVYNEDPELANLSWSNRRLHAAIAYILRATGGRVGGWGSSLNTGGPAGSVPLRTSTYARIWVGDAYHDADVRLIFRTPYSVAAQLLELANPGKPVQQFQPFVYEAEDPGTASPIGAKWEPSPWGARPLWRDVPVDPPLAVGSEYETLDGRYAKREIVTKPGEGPFGWGRETAFAWEKVYSRMA